MTDEIKPQQRAEVRLKMSKRMREAWTNRENNKLGTRANGAKKDEVRSKISESVKKMWEEGTYKDRLNGMTGKNGARTPNWTWGRSNFRDILLQYEEPVCAYCGKTLEEEKLNVHHIDENHDNYLLTNLQWTCVPCHMYNFHYKDTKTRIKHPFISLSKKFSFEYAHILPWHPGKCFNLHGHSGHLEVEIYGRINSLGIVEDFYDIGAAVKVAVIEVFDHKFLNDFIDNPTTENLLVEIWHRLEAVGLKGLRKLTFSETDSSSASLTWDSMVESFGWDFNEGKWDLVPKIDFDKNKIIWSMAHALTNSEGTEKNIHGHDWQAIFEYEGEDISSKMEEWIRKNLDYGCLLYYNHPLLIPYTEGENQFSNKIEKLGIKPVGFEPNAKNIAKFLHKEASHLLKLNPTNLVVSVAEAPYMNIEVFNGNTL